MGEILILNSDLSELEKLEKFLKEYFFHCKLHDRYFNKVYLCISEAVINAIRHGNKYNKNCKVNVTVKYDLKTIDVEVKDEGKGFDYNSIDDPTKNNNIKKESGRGIFIIKSLSNKLFFNNCGNSVRFKIKCS